MQPAQNFTPITPINPALPYLGGKRRLAKQICAKIDQIPHQNYVEPFGGMGGVFLRRSHRPKGEVINDLNQDVSNFFRVARKHPDALNKELALQLNSRFDFECLKGASTQGLTDIERAARFYYLQKCAFGGRVTRRAFGSRKRGYPARFSCSGASKYINALHERLQSVVIEARPYTDILNRYDHPMTLFYLDPPYWGSENDYGNEMFCRSDYQHLAEQLADLEGRFILSINDVPEIRTIFENFKLQQVQTKYSLPKGSPMPTKELIFTN